MKGKSDIAIIGVIALLAIGLYFSGALSALGLGSTVVNGYLCPTCQMVDDNKCEWNDGTYGFRANELKCVSPERATDNGRDFEVPLNFNTCIMSLRLEDGSKATVTGSFDGGVCWFQPDQRLDGARHNGFTVKLIYVAPNNNIPSDDLTPDPDETQVIDDGTYVQETVINGIVYQEIVTSSDIDSIDEVIYDGVPVNTKVIIDSTGGKHLVLDITSNPVGGLKDTEIASILVVIVFIASFIIFMLWRR